MFCMEIITDGNVSAHRAILMARSDVMKAMFTRDFRESRSRSVRNLLLKVLSIPSTATESSSEVLINTGDITRGENRRLLAFLGVHLY